MPANECHCATDEPQTTKEELPYSSAATIQREWEAHNFKLIKQSNEKSRDAEFAANSIRQCVDRSYKESDKVQTETTEYLKTRAAVVYRWKLEIEHLLQDIAREIELQKSERRRVKQSLSVLTISESIVDELLKLRSNRIGTDLVYDNVEEQLRKESSVCRETRELLDSTLQHIELQLKNLKSTKERLEINWSDKNHAYDIDSDCIKLTHNSPTILWQPGVTRFPTDQSTVASHDAYTREMLTAGETERQKSMNLRCVINETYTNAMKCLRDQAVTVELALAEKIKLTEEACHRLEKELLSCLNELATVENVLAELRDSTKGLNKALKLVQTRLANRLQRKNIENCRDEAQVALLEEAKSLSERISKIGSELKRAEETQAGLVKARADLEREIMVKRKSLYIDKERGLLLRSFYPSATALSGF